MNADQEQQFIRLHWSIRLNDPVDIANGFEHV
jgi:hypothetical protein